MERGSNARAALACRLQNEGEGEEKKDLFINHKLETEHTTNFVVHFTHGLGKAL